MATRQVKAENTSMVFGRGDVQRRSELVKTISKKIREYFVTSWNHDEDSEKVESNQLRAGRGSVFGEDSFLWGSGGFSVEIPSEAGFLDLAQLLLNDPNPVSTLLAKKTLVAAKTDLSQVIAANYFKDTTAVTIPVINKNDLADTTVKVVNDQNLSGAGDKTLANNLSHYTQALELTVTPNGSAALTDNSTPGTVVITYTDVDGQTRTFTLSFPNADKTKAQKRNLPAGATVTRVQTTGFKAGKFDISVETSEKLLAENLSGYTDALELTVTPNNSAALSNNSTPGTIEITYLSADGESERIVLSFPNTDKTKVQTTTLPMGATVTRVRTTGFKAGKFDISISVAANIARNPDPNRPGRLRVKYTGNLKGHKMRIRGVRRVGLASSDTLPLREDIELGADVLTEKSFHKIHGVEIKDANGGSVSTLAGNHKVEIISEPGQYETKLKVTDDDVQDATFETSVGGEPWVVIGGKIISGNIEIGDTIAATFEMLSNRVDKRRTIEERESPQFLSSMEQFPDEFEGVSRRFYSGYGRFLEINGEAVICNSVALSIAHNEDFVQGKVPGRFRRDTDASARRLTTLTVNTNYESGSSEEDIFIRWDELFRNNDSVRVRVGTYQWLGDGQQLSIIYDCGNCEITSPVRVEATSPGTIPIDVNLKAVPPEGERGGDVKVTIVSHDQWAA